MEFNWGEPVDPAYVQFVAGIKIHWAKTNLPERWRWHPKDGFWYSYPAPGFSLEDIGAAPTPGPQGWVLGNSAPSFFDSDLIATFGKVKTAYTALSAAHPHACWDPRSGIWLGAKLNRDAPAPEPHPGIPPEALERIARVHAFVAHHDITPEEGRRRILEIIDEYT